MESHPFKQIVETLWEEENEWETNKEKVVKETIQPGERIVGVKVGMSEIGYPASMQFVIRKFAI